MKKTFSKNYNGEEIKSNEVMVPFEYTELEAKSCVNKECICTLFIAGHRLRSIFKAVPKEWIRYAKQDFNRIVNEKLGHYIKKNEISLDMYQDEYELNLSYEMPTEDVVLEKLEIENAVSDFTELIIPLIDKSAKMAYAVMLKCSGKKGTSFYDEMNLQHNAANRILQRAKKILNEGLINFDIDNLKTNKSPYDDEYRKKAHKLLEELIELNK